MSLVTPKELAKAINLGHYGLVSSLIGWVLMETLSIAPINKIYNRHKHLDALGFLNALLTDLNVSYELPEAELNRLPKTGAFITVSNHPLGGIDGILLLKLLIEKRPDYQIIANFLLHRVAPIKPYIMPVNPFEGRKELKSSVSGLKNALTHLSKGHPLGIFPAGEVSTYQQGRQVKDKAWEPTIIRLIQKANVPVIPIYFHAKNSPLFYALSKVNDTLRTAKLPSEMLSKRMQTIKIRVGKPISPKDQQAYPDTQQFSDFLRKKTYMLAKPFKKKNKLISTPNLTFPKTPKEIASKCNVEAMVEEVAALRNTDAKLLTSKHYEVYCSPSKHIPNIVFEIGRLREITFRAVGEGTNESIDLDRFDGYYHHLFLWDKEAQKVAGAYRMGLGKDIYKAYGIKGFYTQELFKFDKELHTMMEHSIELGRAFITEAYQQKPMPLFLLWKGIVHVSLRNPAYKFLIGGVSISNRFSNFSKSLMIAFMKSHYYDPYIAQYIKPKKEYKVKLNDVDKDFVFDATNADLNKFDRLIDEIEPGALRLPVLIKKYVKQNARLVAFNVDPKFNNAIDGLMYIRVSDIPDSTLQPVMEEFQQTLEEKA